MKISPVAASAPKSVNPNEGQSVNPDRLARAKAVAIGQAPEAATSERSNDPQVERAQASIKKIKMRTQRSPDRHLRLEEPAVTEPVATEAASAAAESDTLDATEQTVVASEETKPLSPQFAALAKQKREIQLATQKLEAEKAALAASRTQDLSGYVSKEDIKANALKVLLEQGVTYDQLTEQILASSDESADYTQLRAEVKALKEGLDNQTKSQVQRDADTEKQVLTQMRKEAEQLVAQGDDFEMVREAGYVPQVVDLIHRTYKKTGEVMEVTEALKLIEEDLLNESLKFAKIPKVQSRLTPAQTQQTQAAKPSAPNTKIMRTLTNRDGSSSNSMSKRERAIAAMEGRLSK